VLVTKLVDAFVCLLLLVYHGRWRQGHYIFLFFFHFVSTDVRPAVGFRQNLTSRSEVVSIYIWPLPPKQIGAFPPHLGRKKNIFDHFFATSAVDTTYLRNEALHRRTKMLMSIYKLSPKSWLTFRELWPRNRPRSVCSLWLSLRRPLRCNRHSCNMSSHW